jgi:hypothetical protein
MLGKNGLPKDLRRVEEVRNLAARLQASSALEPSVLMFCGLREGHGVSSVASSVAACLSDGRRRVVLATVGPNDEAGATGVTLSDALAKPGRLGVVDDAPARLYVPDRLSDLPEDARDPRQWAKDSVLVLDSRPIGEFITRHFVPLVLSTVLVVQGEQVSVRAVTRAKKEIADLGGTLEGIVLNRHQSYVPRFVERCADNA